MLRYVIALTAGAALCWVLLPADVSGGFTLGLLGGLLTTYLIGAAHGWNAHTAEIEQRKVAAARRERAEDQR